jgi:hypothetical protein
MIEPVTLGVVVAALIAKMLDRSEDRLLDEGAGVLRRLRATIVERFLHSGDEGGSRALTRFEEAPDSPSRLRELVHVLDTRSEEDPAFAGLLVGLVEEARAAGVEVPTVTQIAVGDQNVQVARADGNVNVTFGSSRGQI